MANFGMLGGGLTLKALLENPDLQSPPVQNGSEKDKKEDEIQFDLGSAFLGPNLWEKTPDNADFNLEYMDLDEFLSENGIPINVDALGSPDLPDIPDEIAEETSLSVDKKPCPIVVTSPISKSPPSSPPQSRLSPPPHAFSISSSREVSSPTDNKKSVDFVVAKEDLALVNIAGEENFDPRKRTFSEEELKPQPMIKKSRKIFVPDDAKDDKYWARRNKNNVAAKRSRDARRIKENQIAMRAAFLEKENGVLRTEMEKIKAENLRLKTSLAKYEPTT